MTPGIYNLLKTVFVGLLLIDLVFVFAAWRLKPAEQRLMDHLTRWKGIHGGGAVLLALVIGFVAGIGAPAAVAILRHGGALVEARLHVAPPATIARAGAAPFEASADLSAYFPFTLNQGNSNACGAAVITTLDYINRRLRGELPPAEDAPWSFFHTYWYAAGGRNDPTTADQEVAALGAAGIEPLANWPVQGPPDATDALHTVAAPGASITYIAANGYHGVGAVGWDATVYELMHNQPVGLLWAPSQDDVAANGQGYTDGGGGWIGFYHFVTGVKYVSDYHGQGPALKILNSWGTSYGVGGAIYLGRAAFESNVLAVFTEAPGRAVARWLPAPVPTAAPLPSPTATTGRRPPSPVPAKAAPPYYGVYDVTRPASLHSTPIIGATATYGVAPPARLRALGAVSGAFVKASVQDARKRPHVGWITAQAVRKETR